MKYYWVYQKVLNGDYNLLISNEFRILNQVEFPVVRPITIGEFQSLLT